MNSTARRRSWGVVSLASLLIAALLLTATSGTAAAGFAFTRYAGQDRYDTARLIAADAFGKSDIVIVTSGTNFPDALAASYAAGLGGVPILLLTGDTIPANTSKALTDLGATKALIVGGTAAVSAAAESALQAKGLTTTRIAGTSRYETSKKVAESGGPGVVGKTGGVPGAGVGANPTAIVVSGENFADALSAGPMAYAGHFPVILTTTAALSPEAKAALSDLGIKTVLIVGGTSAVSTATEKSITDNGATVTRLAGNDRTETATKVADYEVANLSFSTTHVDLARGDAFPDALAASTHGGKVKAPLLLTTNPNDVGNPTRAWLAGHASTLKDGHIDGGTAAVSKAAEDDATSAATTGSTTTTTNPVSTLLTTTTTAPGSTTTSSTLPGVTTPTTAASTTTSSTTTTTPASQLQQCPPGQTGPGVPFCFPASSPPAKPAFASATASTTPPATTATITVTYNEAVLCNTVDANGSDYKVSIDGSAPVQATGAQCLGTSSTTVTITTSPAPIPGDGGTVTAQAGGDGNTVNDANQKSQAVDDTVAFTYVAPAGPKLTSATATAGGTTLTLTYDQRINCATVDSDSSDYTITVDQGPGSPLTGLSATAACTSTSASNSTVTLTLTTGSFQSGQKGSVTVKAGADGDTVKNFAAQPEPCGDSTTYTVT